MKCPHCNHSFPLTWRRYAKSPLGKHICPACASASRFRLSASYLALLGVAWLVYFALAFAVMALIFPNTSQRLFDIPHFVILYFVGCIILIPFDRFFDERFRKLEKPKDQRIVT
jgi:hypothetical protein